MFSYSNSFPLFHLCFFYGSLYGETYGAYMQEYHVYSFLCSYILTRFVMEYGS